MPELEYVDDPWGEEDNWWKPDDLVNQVELNSVFSVTRRTAKRFGSKTERSKWNMIDKQLTSGKIPRNWVVNCVAWARKKNAASQPAIAIRFMPLTRLILNKAKMQDWINKHPQEAQNYVDEANEEWSDDFDE